MVRRRLGELSQLDLAYIFARLLMAASLATLYAAGLIALPPVRGALTMVRGALAIHVFLAALVIVEYLVLGLPTRTVLLTALPFDVAAGGALVVTTHLAEDPAFAWFVGIVVIDALVLSRRESDWSSLLICAAYVTGHLTSSPVHGLADWVLIAFKAAALVIVGYFVSETTFARLERERQLKTNRDSIEDLNEQLHRRVAELNAISEITEVVHSSLDFEVMGPLVIDIVQKVIGLPACSLLVLDKHKAETLFSASAGIGTPPSASSVMTRGDAEEDAEAAEHGEFSWVTLLDHDRMMVVFCAPTDHVDRMCTEDRLMLQAVASELVVAVENAQLYRLTKRLSITDELTGLSNYRHMQQRLEGEFERAVRFDRPLSLLMIDADDFKEYNDRFGHPAGDRALVEVAGVLREMVRDVDIPARYGGEEFSIILPETDAAGAFVVAEKLREAVARHEFLGDDGHRGVHLTVSIGLANFPAHARDRESLLRQADDALYQAKHHGRDRVRSASSVAEEADAGSATVTPLPSTPPPAAPPFDAEEKQA